MKLEKIEYGQYEGQPEEWQLEECTFGKINLIVGKNATGKSRILNIINGLANILSRLKKAKFKSGNYKVYFNKDGEKIVYLLKYRDQKILEEQFTVGAKNFLTRGSNGEGKIYAHQLKKNIKFQVPDDEIVAVVRRDSIQHPFFEDLFTWSDSLIYFPFGSSMGQGNFIVKGKKEIEVTDKIDIKDFNIVVIKFELGKKRFNEKFIQAIKKDMTSVGYEIENIGLGPLKSIIVEGPFLPPMSLLIKEPDLKSEIDQNDISQGMFRTLSLIIQLNYAQMAGLPSCVLIDDIGEGLDYERSSSLIKLLFEKVEKTDTQLIMTTNDSFVMNRVPLQYWSLAQRIRNKTLILNHKNSKKLFEDFELTGLNNFDFFSSDYPSYLSETNKRRK